MAAEEGRAAIWEIDRKTGAEPRLRHRPAQPERHGVEQPTAALWTVVNERDELGSDLVPDYLTSVQRRRLLRLAVQLLRPARRRPRAAAAPRPGRQGDRARLRARPAHGVARPGVVGGRDACRRRSRDGMFVGQHGSWNRKPPSGYKVIFVPFADGKPSGDAGRRADRLPQRGRRAPRAGRSAWRSTRRGALLVADDVGNVVWRVTAAGR